MIMADEISAACGRQNRERGSVFPPKVCVYCFGCPLATVVVGVAEDGRQTGALEVSSESVGEVRDWLATV